MSTNYPYNLDSDLELPGVDSNVTEVGGEAINSLKSAVLALEKAIGTTPQGNLSSLAARIIKVIDEDGKIQSSAIGDIGLVTLPITNAHVSNNAAILESKLDLDFSTQSLKNSINSLSTSLSSLQTAILSNGSDLTQHILGEDLYHDGYGIKINAEGDVQIGVVGLEATNVGDAINELSQILFIGTVGMAKHIDQDLPSSITHTASTISINTSNFSTIDSTVDTVQEAFDDLDASQAVLGIEHNDDMHANGILKEINSGTIYNANNKLLGPITGAYYTEGSNIVTIPGVESFSDLDVSAGCVLEISTSTVADSGTYQIYAVGPLAVTETLGNLPALSATQVAVFGTFVESRSADDSVVVNIYEAASISSDSAPLACSIRNSETLVDTITLSNPNAARVVSIGFNGSIINEDGYNIAILAGIGGEKRGIVIPNLNRTRLGASQTELVTAQTVAERINAYVSDPTIGQHFPISAFKIGDELCIAHNMVGSQYTITILDGYTGNHALGLDSYGADVLDKEIFGSINNNYTVNGKTLDSLTTIFDGYASISSASDTFALWTDNGEMINPLRYGIQAGSVLHITKHPEVSVNGSYTVLTTSSSSVSIFSAEQIPIVTNPTRFDVLVTHANVSLTSFGNNDQDKGLIQVFVDENGKTFAYQRLKYGSSMGANVEITDISDGFAVGDHSIVIDSDASTLTFSLVYDSISGQSVTINNDFEGTFKLYSANGVDYLVIKIKEGDINSTTDTIKVNPLLNTDETLELCMLHFDGNLTITNVSDSRLFGTLSANQIRDDFIEIYTQRPTEELRSNGVVFGFDVTDITKYDSITGMQALPINGGVAYVNGVRCAIETQKVLIPSINIEGTLINGTRIVGLNEKGTLTVFSDTLGEILTDGYMSSIPFGRVLPLYQVTLNNGEISDTIDLRFFINNLDAKVEFVVDQTNNVVGNFRSLEGALLYADSYPNDEKLTIKLINDVTIAEAVTIPNGISIIGSSFKGGSGKHRITTNSRFNAPMLTLAGNNTIQNIEINSSISTANMPLVRISGSNVLMEKNLLRFGDSITTNSGNVGVEIAVAGQSDVVIENNSIDNIYTGILSEHGCENLIIKNNNISNLCGTGGVSVGISVGTETRPVDRIVISGNTIDIPSVSSETDIRGIFVDVGETITQLTIKENSILHTAANTGTNGIRIENALVTGNVVSNLIVSDNVINGIKLNDSDVRGIYVSSATTAKVHHNLITNVGVAGNTSVSGISIQSDVVSVEITNNTIKSCGLETGIDVTTAKALITGNVLDTLSSEADYIYGTGTRAIISDNKLVGPGTYGIYWTGLGSTISNNNLNGGGTTFAFSSAGICAPCNEIEIINNTVRDMTYDTDSVGIKNGPSRSRAKIIGNTVSGSLMSVLIGVYGSDNIVSNNRLENTTASAVQTDYIKMYTLTDSLISNNIMHGAGHNAIISDDGTLDTTSIINNTVEATISARMFDFATATNCFLIGNKHPYTAPAQSDRIGATPSSTTTNSNTIGPNKGTADTFNIPLAMGVSSATSNVVNWEISSSNNYWIVASSAAGDKHLYFPLAFVPNGAKINSIQVSGYHVSDTLTFNVKKKSMSSATLAVTTTDTDSSTPTSGYFGRATSNGLITLSTAITVNHYESSYYLEIIYTGGTAITTQIHSVGINFTY